MNRQNLFNRMGYPGQLGGLGDVIAGIEQDFADIIDLVERISAKLNGKVNAATGKALSTNDFSDEYKKKLCEVLGISGRKVNLQGDERALFNEDRLTTIELEVV